MKSKTARKRGVRAATKRFERAENQQTHTRYVLTLFIAGTTPLSAAALRNVVAVCDERLPGRYDLEVVDVFRDPARAKEAQVIAIPTLIRHQPAPRRHLVGDLSDREQVLVGLELTPNHPLESSP